MKLTVIGSSGSFAGSFGPASCYLVEHDGVAVVLDLGNGALSALSEYRDIYDIEAILLSHLHLDHIADLGGLYVARRYRRDVTLAPLPVYGPSDVAERVGRMYASSDEEGDLSDSFAFRGYDVAGFKVGPFTVSIAPAAHPVESYCVRLDAGGKSLVFSGDTGPCPELVTLAQDADLLLVEASFLEDARNPADLHLTAREAVHHGVEAGVRTIVLTHLVPWNNIDDTLAEAHAARTELGFTGDLLLARTGLAVEL